MKVDFVDGYVPGWVMCVPECFRNSLQTEIFSAGDTFYDSIEAYKSPSWREAVKHIKVAVQVRYVLAGEISFDVLALAPDSQSLKIIESKTLKTNEFINSLKYGFT